jgi:hypothetical protein
MALAMVPAGSSRPIEKIVPGPLCFDAHFGAPLPPAPGAAAPPPAPPPRYATGNTTTENQAALADSTGDGSTERAPASSTHRNISARRAPNERNFKTC